MTFFSCTKLIFGFRSFAWIALAAILGAGALGVAGCAPNPAPGGDGGAVDVAAVAESADYAVELAPVSGEELLAALGASDSDSSDEGTGSEPISIDVAVDDSARRVDMTVVVGGGDVEQVTTAAEAAARALSAKAKVTAADGVAAPEGPLGALYQAYSLYLRAYNGTTGEFFDGTLSAGADEIMWQ